MKSNQIKIGAILSYISFGIGVIASIIYTPIMIRLLGKSDYGLYNLASSIISYLGLLNLGFGAAYIKYFSLYKKDGDNKNLKCSDCNADITAAVDTFSTKRYGKSLCRDCQKKQ